MILLLLILIMLAGGLLAATCNRFYPGSARWIAMCTMIVDLLLTASIWLRYPVTLSGPQHSQWHISFLQSWIPQIGVNLYLALDGLSLILITLTLFLGILSVLVSWKEITRHPGFYYFNLIWVFAGILGVFLALDLFLFYFFWEIMLIPMYFLIAVWGHGNRVYAAYKFFIYTQLSGLLMLLAILGVYFIHGQNTGQYTFNYNALIGTHMRPFTAWWLMWGFIIAFAVKLPALPLHNWLPNAHAEAPTAGSVILAGLLLKTGAYGLLRFVIPLFPNSVEILAPWAMLIGVIGILYGAVLAFSQTDIKRLIAYTSVSHMGFVLLGIFSLNEWGYQGAVLQMVAHGLSTSALFIIAGMLYERLHTRDLNQMSGLWQLAPRMGGAAMLFVMASLGLPGLANFVAEFLILIAAWQVNAYITVIAVIGLVLATVYSLRLMQQTFLGPNANDWTMPDCTARELIIITALIAALVIIGLYPQPLIDTARPTIAWILEIH